MSRLLLADRLCYCCSGDCAIASSFVSYLGPFNKEFRELLITRDFYGGCVKLNIPVTKDMQVTKFLVDDSEVGEWTLQVGCSNAAGAGYTAFHVMLYWPDMPMYMFAAESLFSTRPFARAVGISSPAQAEGLLQL